ncbi:MAG: phage tail sheath C-terminal domain-containing protein [Halieaceae bacterium]|nr:phage tail sheath C-terminal domain-containing protein [Halieaceae bacterium]
MRSVSEYAGQFGPPGGDPGGIHNEGAAADVFGHAINAFFVNGGSQAYVVPVARTAGKVSRCTVAVREDVANADDLTHTVIFVATSPGTWADSLLLRLEQDATGTFTLTIGTQDAASLARTDVTEKRHDRVLETFTGLSLATRGRASIKRRVNGVSALVKVKIAATAIALAGDSNDARAELAGGADSATPRPANYSSALERLQDYRDISIVLLPGRDWTHDRAVYERAIAHAGLMKNRMVIVDPQNPQTSATALNDGSDVMDAAFPVSSWCALYYPYLKVSNPYYDARTAATLPDTFEIGPSAMAAGVWARIDRARGVWKAPAGLEATVLGTLGPNVQISQAVQDNLNPLGVNCLRPITGPPAIWGARTLASASDAEYRYISVRRTRIMIRESLYNALQTVVFETNDQALWSRLRASVDEFMGKLFRDGAFQGSKASDAYFARCGLGSTMTQSDIDAGIVRLQVGFAPLKPAEFVIVDIQQRVGQTSPGV